MKVRKLAVALALAGGLSSGLAHALGMGEGQILTRLNEPLRAEIELTRPGDVSKDEIKIGLAPEEDFERFGIRRMGILHQLDFEVTRDGDNKLIVEVTTDEPIREPFLKMLVELTWPNGRLMREYSFLVDPPERSRGPDAAGPEADSGTGQSQARAPEPTEQRSTATGGQTGSQSGQSDEYGPTSANDTLWSIAGRINTPADVSRQQVMLALQEANPNAFANGNINQLRRGQVLRLPSEQEIRARSTQEAVREVMAQNEAFRSRRGEPTAEQAVADSGEDSNGQGAGTGATADAGSGDDELRILVADNESGNGEGDIAGMGDGEGDEKLAAALEELDRAQRDREELESRLGDLEEQIDTMAQLIELKDDQLAEMQQRLAEADGDTEIPEEPEAGEDFEEADQASAADDGDTDDEQAEVAAAAGDDGPDPETDEAADPDDDGSGDSQGEQAAEDTGAGDEAAADQQQTDSATGEGTGASDTEQNREQTGMPEAPTSVGGFFDRLVREPIYQIGAGAIGIVLLLLLWALARRNAAREKAFYDQIRDISGDEQTEDVLDLEVEGEGPAAGEASGEAADEAESEMPESGDDLLAEVDFYMAYGRYGQAAQHLEEAISQEPSRTDLRLKLLEVYAAAGDSETFEKQYRELSALGDDSAVEKADALREQIADAGEDLSIDDLAEQLKTGTGTESEASGAEIADDDSFDFSALDEADELLAEDDTQSSGVSAQGEEADLGFEEDFGFDDEALEGAAEESNDSIDFEYTDVPGAGEADTAEPASTSESGEEDVEDLGFSLEDLELEEPEAEEAPAADSSAEESGLDLEEAEAIPDTSEFADLTTDEEEIPVAEPEAEAEPGEPLAEEEPEPLTEISESVEEQETPQTSEAADAEAFDDSFLEELDAELDKVTEEESAGESEEAQATGEAPAETEEESSEGSTEEDLGDLELDVSDDDLALMDELTGDDASEASGEQSADELLDEDPEEAGAEETLSDEEKAALEGDGIPTADTAAGEAEAVQEEGADAAPGTGESESTDSSEDDEFDFLEGTDEAGTKLDLARAYVEMGDAEGARDILEEVAKEGNDEQQQEAQRLLNEL